MHLSEVRSWRSRYQGRILAPPALWPGPRPTRSAACSRPPRAETPPLPATCCWPRRLLRSQPDHPSHGRGNVSSRPFGNGRWGGAGRFNCLVSLISADVTRRFAGHAVPPRHHGSQTMSDDRRIALTEAGRRPVMVVLCKPKLSGCRRGSVRNPGDPNRLSKLRRSPCCASRQHTSGCHGNQPSWHVRQGQQSSDWSGFGSEREGRNMATTSISLFRLFTQFPS